MTGRTILILGTRWNPASLNAKNAANSWSKIKEKSADPVAMGGASHTFRNDSSDHVLEWRRRRWRRPMSRNRESAERKSTDRTPNPAPCFACELWRGRLQRKQAITFVFNCFSAHKHVLHLSLNINNSRKEREEFPRLRAPREPWAEPWESFHRTKRGVSP